MDIRPIGVFDSGLGGLTAVKELCALLPNEDIIYFGDTGRVPYGTRSNETIIKYVRQDIRFLTGKNVKAVVAACGTASAVAVNLLKDEFDLPIIGVLEPTCKTAAERTVTGRIGVLGTPGTVNSGAYGKLLRSYKKGAAVFEKACPMFVPLVENGYIDSPATYIIAGEYLKPMLDDRIDAIILGCTHYPLLIKVISDILGPAVSIINSGYETALHTKKVLSANGLLSENKTGKSGKIDYYISDSVEKFTYFGNLFLEREIAANVKKIDIELY
jgi:glutamate racemase